MYLMSLSALSFRRLSKPKVILLSCLNTHAFFFHFSSDLLTWYVDSAQGNWNNFNLDNRYISNTMNNNGLKSEPEDPNRPGDNPDNLDKLDGIYH